MRLNPEPTLLDLGDRIFAATSASQRQLELRITGLSWLCLINMGLLIYLVLR